jgi:hypothetical protein
VVTSSAGSPTMPLAAVSWSEPTPTEPRRWNRVLLVAAVALGILGAAVATALRLHFG